MGKLSNKKLKSLRCVHNKLGPALRGETDDGVRLTKLELDTIWETLSEGEIALYKAFWDEDFIYGTNARCGYKNCVMIDMVGYRGPKSFLVERGKVYSKKDTRTGDSEWTNRLRTFLAKHGLYEPR